MKVTIRDVATKANVSITSVSQVLNGKDIRITMEKRMRILEVARELGYEPNHFAVSLKGKPGKNIGLIVPDISNLYFTELAKGIMTATARLGCDVMLWDSDNQAHNDIKALKNFRRKGIDKIVIALSSQADVQRSLDLKAMLRNILEEKGASVVLVDRSDPEYRCSAVRVNHLLGGALAARHLLALGHTEIGCITGPLDLESAGERYYGCRSALLEAGIVQREGLAAQGDFSWESGYRLTDDLLAHGATAIFACNDMMAYGVYRRLRERGIRIPMDLSVIGFDDVTFSNFLDPPLTTISQPICELGAKAVELLMECAPLKTVVMFEPQLILRESTAAPAARG